MAAALAAQDFLLKAVESIANGELGSRVGVKGVEDGEVDAGEVLKGPVAAGAGMIVGLLGFAGYVSCGAGLWIVRVRPLHSRVSGSKSLSWLRLVGGGQTPRRRAVRRARACS